MPNSNATVTIVTILLVIALLPAAYMGAYYAMLEEVRVAEESAGGWAKLVPSYRVKGAAVELFFTPAYEIDRRIRPGYW